MLLKGAGRSQGGLLQIYQGDFPSGPEDKRRPVPWDMFRDYVQAAIKLGKTYEKQAKLKDAERIYRRVISLGRQFLDEPGGFQFVNWGMTFQKQGAEALARLLTSSRSAEKQQASAFVNLTSRRLDLLQTALNSLDDMADYKSLKAAILASGRTGDPDLQTLGDQHSGHTCPKGRAGRSKCHERGGGHSVGQEPHHGKEGHGGSE